jgi:Transposase DDE domain
VQSQDDRGWVQGYNAQAVVGEGQIVLAAEISIESLDTASVQPMVETALRELEAAGVTATPEVVVADAGYCKNDAIDTLVAQGIRTLVAPDADRRKEPRPGRRGGLYDFARRALATDWGQELCLRRQGIVEPVFGQVKSKSRREPLPAPRQIGRQVRMAAADGHHNLLTLHRHQLATA